MPIVQTGGFFTASTLRDVAFMTTSIFNINSTQVLNQVKAQMDINPGEPPSTTIKNENLDLNIGNFDAKNIFSETLDIAAVIPGDTVEEAPTLKKLFNVTDEEGIRGFVPLAVMKKGESDGEGDDSSVSIFSVDPEGSSEHAYVTINAPSITVERDGQSDEIISPTALSIQGRLAMGSEGVELFHMQSLKQSELHLGKAIRIVNTEMDPTFDIEDAGKGQADNTRHPNGQALVLGSTGTQNASRDDFEEEDKPVDGILVIEGRGRKPEENEEVGNYVAPFYVGRTDTDAPHRVCFGSLESRQVENDNITHPVGVRPSVASFTTDVELKQAVFINGIVSNDKGETVDIDYVRGIRGIKVSDTFLPEEVYQSDALVMGTLANPEPQPLEMTATFFDVSWTPKEGIDVRPDFAGTDVFVPNKIADAVFGMEKPQTVTMQLEAGGETEVTKQFRTRTTMYGPDDESDGHALDVHHRARIDELLIGGDKEDAPEKVPGAQLRVSRESDRVSEDPQDPELVHQPAVFVIQGDEGEEEPKSRLAFGVDVAFIGDVNFGGGSGSGELRIEKVRFQSQDIKEDVTIDPQFDQGEAKKGTILFDKPSFNLPDGESEPEDAEDVEEFRLMRALRRNDLIVQNANIQLDTDKALYFADFSETDETYDITDRVSLDVEDQNDRRALRTSHNLTVGGGLLTLVGEPPEETTGENGEGPDAPRVDIRVLTQHGFGVEEPGGEEGEEAPLNTFVEIGSSLRVLGNLVVSNGKIKNVTQEEVAVKNSILKLGVVHDENGDPLSEPDTDHLFHGIHVFRGDTLPYKFGFVADNSDIIHEQDVFAIGSYDLEANSPTSSMKAVMTRNVRSEMEDQAMLIWNGGEDSRHASTVDDITVGANNTQVPQVGDEAPVGSPSDTDYFAIGGTFDPTDLENGTVEATRNLFVKGDVFAINGVFQEVTTLSDERLKTNIQTVEDSLDTVNRMRGVHYNWKSNADGEKVYGVVAQEVEKVVPELIVENPATKYKTVNYTGMSALFIQAIKELTAKVSCLQEELASVKAQLESK